MTSNLHWVDPLLYAAGLKDEENLVLLYSGTSAGQRSILAWDLQEKITDLDSLKDALGHGEKLFGWVGYGLRNKLERLDSGEPSAIELEDVFFARFKNVLVFDHVTKAMSYSGIDPNIQPLEKLDSRITRRASAMSQRESENDEVILKSSMTDAEYEQKVQYIIDEIAAGKLYQANLTRKFSGEFENEPGSFALFCELAKKSPAPYSAFMKFGDVSIVSSSPEKFLSIADGVAVTKPIKGTMPSSRPASDLANSEKDKAENLMIVDLMRNDLSKTCANVQTPELFKVTTYPAYHHLHSTVTGEIKGTPLDTVLGCFPAGSMTGAPKIAAINLCNKLEGVERGLYSGALGWIDADSCDFSVVIRTLIIRGKQFEFQAGGGITSGSVPANELAEMYTKCKPIMELLNIKAF